MYITESHSEILQRLIREREAAVYRENTAVDQGEFDEATRPDVSMNDSLPVHQGSGKKAEFKKGIRI